MDIEKTRYRYLAVLYLFSFFGDIFLRLHLRDLCYTGHNERLKNRDYFSFHIYIRLTLCYNVFSRGILWLKFGRVFNSSPTPSAKYPVPKGTGLCVYSGSFLFALASWLIWKTAMAITPIITPRRRPKMNSAIPIFITSFRDRL